MPTAKRSISRARERRDDLDCEIDGCAIRHVMRKHKSVQTQSAVADGATSGVLAQSSGVLPVAVTLFTALSVAQFWKTAPAPRP